MANLLPGSALPQEWAYAGMIFDLTGATLPQRAPGDGISHIVTLLVVALLVLVSWGFRPEGRKLKPA